MQALASLMALEAPAYDALTDYARPKRIAKVGSESRSSENLREHRRKLDAGRAARIIRIPLIEKSQPEERRRALGANRD